MPTHAIRIHLEYAAVLDLQGLPNRGELELPPGARVGDVLRLGGIRDEQAGYVISAVNGKRRRLDTVLQDGDRLSLRLPLGGG
jgi:hypothetical protein